MKFTKEDAYKDLVAKLTENGEKLNLSERSINEQLDTLMPMLATDDTEMSDFVSKTLPLFKTTNANVRNDVSVHIREYEQQKPNQSQQKQKPQEQAKSELELRLESLEKELSEAKRIKHDSEVKDAIATAMREKGVKNEEWIKSLLDEVSITEDFDVEGKVNSYIGLYNKSQASIETNVSPKGANGSRTDYATKIIKEASKLAESNNLVG